MRLGLMEMTVDGKRAVTLFGAGGICATAHLIDFLCAGLSDPGSAALTANAAFATRPHGGCVARVLDGLCPTAWEIA